MTVGNIFLVVLMATAKPNLNDATVSQLKKVHQIGKTLAKRIYERRREKPFSTWSELDELYQIGSIRMRNQDLFFVLEIVQHSNNNNDNDKSWDQATNPADRDDPKAEAKQEAEAEAEQQAQGEAKQEPNAKGENDEVVTCSEWVELLDS